MSSMFMNFESLQNEVLRRATRNQSDNEFTTAIKNAINSAILRTAREALWRSIRRKGTITTKGLYSTGTDAVSVTNGSPNVTVTGATFVTDDIRPGRRVELGGSNQNYIIDEITGETTMVVNLNYDGTTSTSQTYSIFGQEEYNLPLNSSHRMFIWHEKYGVPATMRYVTDQDFYDISPQISRGNIPQIYRMWGSDMLIRPVPTATTLTVASSSSSDTSKKITIFGTVAGFPDFEQITTDASDGTTSVSGAKTFSDIDRVVKADDTVGRITVSSSSPVESLATIPVGSAYLGAKYDKMQVWPLPDDVFDMTIQYYEDPYPLINNDDVHIMGGEFDEAIILLATSRVNMEQNKTEGANFFLLWQDEIKSLKRTNVDKIDYDPHFRRPKNNPRARGSRFFHRGVSYDQAGPFYGPRS